MKVALVYDEVPDPGLAARLPEDCGAEFEDAQTIQALLRAIRACGYEAVEVVLGADFLQHIRNIDPPRVGYLSLYHSVCGPPHGRIRIGRSLGPYDVPCPVVRIGHHIKASVVVDIDGASLVGIG